MSEEYITVKQKQISKENEVGRSKSDMQIDFITVTLL